MTGMDSLRRNIFLTTYSPNWTDLSAFFSHFTSTDALLNSTSFLLCRECEDLLQSWHDHHNIMYLQIVLIIIIIFYFANAVFSFVPA